VGQVAAFRVSQNNADSPTDRELIARTLGGDEAAFALIIDRFQRRLFRVAMAIVRDETEADIITHDSFVQAYTHLARFQGRAELETWLTRIVINRSRDLLRRRKFLSLFTRDEDGGEVMIEPADEHPDPEREIMSRQLRVAIERAQVRLSAQQKIIFRLRHYEQHSLEDIAEMLGLQAGTVRAHLFRAVHKVRDELAEWMNRSPRKSKEEADEAL
jgi:RNA polymerase sigma-70 factor, ECF subfamily